MLFDNKKKLFTAREFVSKVGILAKKYNLPVFVVTDGASLTSNKNCEAVKNARNAHIEWEKKNNIDPYHNYSFDKQEKRFKEHCTQGSLFEFKGGMCV